MKQVNQSALLYIWLAVAPVIIGEMHSDTAKNVIPMPYLWIGTLLFSVANVGAVALKSFRSKEYSESQEPPTPPPFQQTIK